VSRRRALPVPAFGDAPACGAQLPPRRSPRTSRAHAPAVGAVPVGCPSGPTGRPHPIPRGHADTMAPHAPPSAYPRIPCGLLLKAPRPATGGPALPWPSSSCCCVCRLGAVEINDTQTATRAGRTAGHQRQRNGSDTPTPEEGRKQASNPPRPCLVGGDGQPPAGQGTAS
jgi:hypothetical protein